MMKIFREAGNEARIAHEKRRWELLEATARIGEKRGKELNMITTICGGIVENWKSRKKAMASFAEAACGSDGSEKGRYIKIYDELAMGYWAATDWDGWIGGHEVIS